MRLHVADLSLESFLAKRSCFVELMKGDYFFGTRDVTMTSYTARALFQHGIPGWLDAMLDAPTGNVVKSNLDQLATEIDRVYLGGSMNGDVQWAPEELIADDGLVRDGGLATIGGGNHFVEIQVVEAVEDRATAYAWGVREGQLAFMVHSGSRNVGKYIGGMWRERAAAAWPKNLAYPESRLFPLSVQANPNLVTDYLQGACNRTVFETWLENCLLPTLKAGQVLVMDNATFHKGGRISQLIEDAGCQLLYLPPYSPDLNKIEQCGSWLKSRLRKQRPSV
jgi:tRNA-splicing ligase RtcB